MHTDRLTVSLSPDPILSAVDDYRGSIFDLDRSLMIDAASLARGREELARKMGQFGLAHGDRVVMAVGNGPLFIAALAAILMRGGAPLLTHTKTPPAELKRTSLQFGAKFIVSDSWTAAEMLAAAPTSRTISPAPALAPWAQLVWAEGNEADPTFEGSYCSLPAVPLHPTSGTTGQPKVAVRPGPCAIAEAEHYVETIGIDPGDVILAVPPMSHAYAYGMCVMVPLLTGANVVSMRRFKRKLVFQAFEERGITIFPAVPAMLDVLLFGAGDRLRHAPRCVLSAGAPLSERTATAFKQKSGTTVRPLYGTTETGGISVAMSEGEALAGGCVGPPMKGVSLQVRPNENRSDSQNALVPCQISTDGCHGHLARASLRALATRQWHRVGQSKIERPLVASQHSIDRPLGTLSVRSSSMMVGYLDRGGIDASALSDGWFQTGDLAQLDAAGAIHLKGRETEVINVAGMKVVPSEVEGVIASIPQVAEVKVYAGKHRSGTQFVKTAVVAGSALDVSDIRAHCETHLVYFKRPSAIVFVKSLPKTPSGKIILDQLP